MAPRTTPTRSAIDAPWGLVALGAVLGLTWGASLRGLMSILAGPASTVEWSGTFIEILAPAAIIGGLFGWAEYLRRYNGPSWRRWFALSPVVFGLAALTAVTSWADLGAAAARAFGITVAGIIGGYALSGVGPAWARLVTGLAAAVPVVVFAVAVPDAVGSAFGLARPRGLWMTVYFAGLLTVFYLGSSIPFRRAPTLVAA